MNDLRRVHLIAGFVTLLAFLLSGVYMRFFSPHRASADAATHLLFRSRHIYILAVALVHLALAAYLTRARTSLQYAGSACLVASSLLTIAAFVIERPPMFRGTPLSRLGIFVLFAGVMLHLLASRDISKFQRVR